MIELEWVPSPVSQCKQLRGAEGVVLITVFFQLQKFEIVSKPRPYEDTRSIDDLLAFIDGVDGGIFTHLFFSKSIGCLFS